MYKFLKKIIFIIYIYIYGERSNYTGVTFVYIFNLLICVFMIHVLFLVNSLWYTTFSIVYEKKFIWDWFNY
jgi:hypothetical protein